MKKYFKSYLYLFGIIVTCTLILSVVNYFIKLPTYIIKIIIPIMAMFMACVILGKKCLKKAYLEGIKFSGFYLLLVTIIKIVLKTAFNYKVIIIYLTLIMSGIIGSIMGINLKNKA